MQNKAHARSRFLKKSARGSRAKNMEPVVQKSLRDYFPARRRSSKQKALPDGPKPTASNVSTTPNEPCKGQSEAGVPKRKLQEPLSEPFIPPCTPKRRKANEEVLSRLSKAPEPLSRGKKMVQMAKQKAACATPTKRTRPSPVSENPVTTRRKLFGPPATDDQQGGKVVATANPMTVRLSTPVVSDIVCWHSFGG